MVVAGRVPARDTHWSGEGYPPLRRQKTNIET
jgi:hypothetical protein